MFSSDDVAKFINDSFEPVWESVRPVPIVRIDFGNGNVVTRTLHGNIATYVCNADGRVLDVLPGIYEPQQYAKSLKQLQLLHSWLSWPGGADLARKLRMYHERQAAALKAKEQPAEFVLKLDTSKYQVESPIKLIAAADAPNYKRVATFSDPPKIGDATEAAARTIAKWPALAEDTKVNESIRREQIHTRLTNANVKPADLVKWLYKDVLKADLDDPYLGLGQVLFDGYPFAAEDAKSR